MLLNFNSPVNIKLFLKTNCKNNYYEVSNTSHKVTRTTTPQVKCEAVTRLKQVCSHQCRQILKLMFFPTVQGLWLYFNIAFTLVFQLFLTTWNLFGKIHVHVTKPLFRKAPSSICILACLHLHSVSSSLTNSTGLFNRS